MNNAAVDKGQEALIKVNVPESWKNAVDEEVPVKKEEPEFVKRFKE